MGRDVIIHEELSITICQQCQCTIHHAHSVKTLLMDSTLAGVPISMQKLMTLGVAGILSRAVLGCAGVRIPPFQTCSEYHFTDVCWNVWLMEDLGQLVVPCPSTGVILFVCNTAYKEGQDRLPGLRY